MIFWDGTYGGQVREVDGASNGVLTFWFQDGDDRWGERYYTLGNTTVADPESGSPLPVFQYVERVKAR